MSSVICEHVHTQYTHVARCSFSGTFCLYKPARWATEDTEMPTAGVKDTHYRRLLGRLTSLLAAALLAKTKCSTQSELLTQEVRLIQTSLKAHVAKQLRCGLTFKTSESGSDWLLGSSLGMAFTNELQALGS